MKKVELKNAKEKFAKARELCPGMEEEMYVMTDYLATVIKDAVIPTRLILTVSSIENAIKKGKNSYKESPLPELFIKDPWRASVAITALSQCVDEIADKDFADEYRKLGNDFFGAVLPKKINTANGEDYPEYAKVAAEYWANTIQTRNFNNGDALTSIFAMAIAGSKREYTKEELKIFKESLAETVYEKVETYGTCTLDVDYGPCYLLAKAGKLIDVDPFDYPWKTSMIATKEKVTVHTGYGADRKVLYQQNSDVKSKQLTKDTTN